ncbi:MAG: hypothetical protein IJL91_10020, partial [Bacteroidales bacterium]|nr:hypothetical protein [Bacteroidales bacterium]
MYNNQDILKKHTSLMIRRKDVETSFIMFPVRLETRIVENHEVEDISEPDRALYAFKAIWDYVSLLGGCSESDLVAASTKVMTSIEDLDTVYKEDRSRLRNLSKRIVEATSPQGEIKQMWDRVLTHIDRLTTLDVVSDNEATDFLNRLEFVSRTVKGTIVSPRYDGRIRKQEKSPYSKLARFRAAHKNLSACLPILAELLPEDPADSIVNRFSHISKKQFDKFINLISFFDLELSYKTLSSRYCFEYFDLSKAPRNKNGNISIPLLSQMFNKVYDDANLYQTYAQRFFGKVDSRGNIQVKPRKQSLIDKMRSKIGNYSHYTLFAEKMILWQLRKNTGAKQDIANNPRVKQWRDIAENTIFSFHEEREWMVSVLKVYNSFKESKNCSQMISAARLNKHNKFIRPRKLCYKKKQKCLLVRIYPDEIAVTQMSRPITKIEIENALDFWVNYFYEEGNQLKQRAAWEAMCSLHTPPRAALIVRSLFPNSSPALTQLKNEVIRKKALLMPFDKLSKEVKDEARKKLITPGVEPSAVEVFPVPFSELMPDRFILQANLDNGEKKGFNIIQYGRLIPKTIQVGLDLNKEAPAYKSAEGPKFDGNLRWLTDYDAAEKMGMAITLPLTPYIYDHFTKKQKADAKKKGRKLGDAPLRRFKFTSIYVMGVKEFSPDNEKDSDACGELLRKIFNSHLYSEEGLELLKVGTPTNILDGGDSDGSGNVSDNSEYDT